MVNKVGNVSIVCKVVYYANESNCSTGNIKKDCQNVLVTDYSKYKTGFPLFLATLC